MIFDHKLWLFGVSFHTWTFVVLLGTLIIDFIFKRKQGMKTHLALVHATALTTFSIHFYEILHSGAETYFTGFQSPSMWIVNLPLALIALGILFYLEFPNPRLVSTGCFLWFALIMLHFMGEFGFFSLGFPKTVEWAFSKVSVSLSTILFFVPMGVRRYG